jgi:hypothetical protein
MDHRFRSRTVPTSSGKFDPWSKLKDKEGQGQLRMSVREYVPVRKEVELAVTVEARTEELREIKANKAVTRSLTRELRLKSGLGRGFLCGSPTEGSHTVGCQPVQSDTVFFSFLFLL